MSQQNQTITPFLTFPGNAEEAVGFYVHTFPGSRIISLTRYGKDERMEEGKVLNATFELRGRQFMAMDMGKADVPAFTWAMSLFVECTESDEFDRLFARLSDGGNVLMGPEPVMGLRKVAWVTDKFHVTWQLVWR